MGALHRKPEAVSLPQIGDKMTLCVATPDLGDSVPSGDLVPSVVSSPYVMCHFCFSFPQTRRSVEASRPGRPAGPMARTNCGWMEGPLWSHYSLIKFSGGGN